MSSPLRATSPVPSPSSSPLELETSSASVRCQSPSATTAIFPSTKAPTHPCMSHQSYTHPCISHPKLYSSLHILRIQSYTHPCTSFASKAILIPAHPSHPKLYSSLHTSLHIIAHFLYSFIYLYFSPFQITEIAAAHTICPSVMHLSHSLVPGPPRNVFMYAVGSLHMWNS